MLLEQCTNNSTFITTWVTEVVLHQHVQGQHMTRLSAYNTVSLLYAFSTKSITTMPVSTVCFTHKASLSATRAAHKAGYGQQGYPQVCRSLLLCKDMSW